MENSPPYLTCDYTWKECPKSHIPDYVTLAQKLAPGGDVTSGEIISSKTHCHWRYLHPGTPSFALAILRTASLKAKLDKGQSCSDVRDSIMFLSLLSAETIILVFLSLFHSVHPYRPLLKGSLEMLPPSVTL